MIAALDRLRFLGVLATLLGLGILASCAVDRTALASSIDLRDVDLSLVADGTYEATYAISTPAMAANKTVGVKVTVAHGSYEAVQIVTPPQMNTDKVISALVDRIRESGHLSMDAVAGATITSAAVLKAVQLAVSGKGN